MGSKENFSRRLSYENVEVWTSRLTRREAQCLRKLAEGLTIKQIAGFYGISGRAVDYYLQSARDKLTARSNCELIFKACLYGTLPLTLDEHERLMKAVKLPA